MLIDYSSQNSYTVNLIMKNRFKFSRDKLVLNSGSRTIQLTVRGGSNLNPYIVFNLRAEDHRVKIQFKSNLWRKIYSARNLIIESMEKKQESGKRRVKKEFFLNTDKLKIFVKNLHGSRAVFFVSGGKEIRIMKEKFLMHFLFINNIHFLFINNINILNQKINNFFTYKRPINTLNL